jgi:Rieske Fe-S protein
MVPAAWSTVQRDLAHTEYSPNLALQWRFCRFTIADAVPRSLPISADQTAAGCAGCSRRAVLRGAAVAAAGLALGVGCDADDDGGANLPPGPGSDGGANVPKGDGGGAGTGAAFTMCDNGVLCLDLSDPRNAALMTVGGSLEIPSPHNILVIRDSDADIRALTEICTHAACNVGYDSVGNLLVCPCHGSQYSLDGAVVHGPASLPLKKYGALLDVSHTMVKILL